MFTNKLNSCLLRSQYLALPVHRSSPLSLEFPKFLLLSLRQACPLWQS